MITTVARSHWRVANTLAMSTMLYTGPILNTEASHTKLVTVMPRELHKDIDVRSTLIMELLK